MIQPVKAGYDQAYNSVPSINDGWYDTLTKINNQAPKEAIITSWWDFGHWFKAIADRRVTFDGAARASSSAHWVGRSLLISSEDETTGILMMLNCGQNKAFDTLNGIFNDAPKSVDILHQVLVQDKAEAIITLKDRGLTTAQIAEVIQYLHCENPPVDYYITSDDMIGKAGVWGHFGSWDFKKAAMYQETKDMDKEGAVKLLVDKYDLSSSEADKTYYEIQNTDADKWIAPWPSYFSNLNQCDGGSAGEVTCIVSAADGNIKINANPGLGEAVIIGNKGESLHPVSVVYATKQAVVEKRFTDSAVPFSVILIPQSDGKSYSAMIADPLLAYSTFTKLFFFDGHGMKCFSKFDEVKTFVGGKISTWVVDYDCKQENKVFFAPVEEVKAAHILISTKNRSDEQALQLAQEIEKNLTTANFAEYAKRLSEDPGSGANGGELGWFGKGTMVSEFEAAAFGLKVGEISSPVKSQFGYHIILLEDRREK
jgi:parvulin-like peptidyl-prolyl isomerase